MLPLFVIQKSSFAKNDEPPPYLTCPILKTRTKEFLEYHYAFRSFDEELSKRTFGNYLRFLDPGKLFFLQSDVKLFSSQYQNSIGKKINSVDCAFIGEIYNLYLKRVNESLDTANTILNGKIDFSIDEYIETDRKKIDWAQSSDELQDRWRKTIKFILLNMKEQDQFSKTLERVQKRYELLKKDVNSRTSDEINSIFLNAFALSLDPHSSFLTPTDNAQFQIDFSLKLVGIGATLMSPDGFTIVDAIVPGGAAARDGRLKKGDKIVAVDPGDGNGFQDVIDMNINKVVQLVRGKAGTVVKLIIMRNEPSGAKRFQIQLTRALVEIKENEAKSDIMTINNKKIGIINLPSFYIDYQECQSRPATCRSSANDMLREIKKLSKQNVDGIVLDLRRNGGGDLTESERIVSFFISNPVVTQVEDRDSVVHRLEVSSKSAYTGPLAVLISRYTASASEIFAGAVQDYGRGLIVGDSKTFGKGTVQTVIDIPGTGDRQTNGAIHVTIAKFFRPSGKSNQEKGVISDIPISNPTDFYSIGESDYDYVLPYTTIKPAPNFHPYQSFTAFVPQLKKMSQERLKQLTNYKEIQEAINKAQEKQNTLVSLKEIPVKKTKKSATTDLEDDDNPFKPQVVISEKDYELKEAAQILLDSTKLIGQTNWEADRS